jgi:hypothetical protein
VFGKSESITELAKSLAIAQSKMKPATKSGKNTFFQDARYSTLEDIWEACRGPLTESGLSVYQSPSMTETGLVQVTTMLLHSSGEYLVDRLVLKSRDGSPQAVGSAITYGKRYALAAIAGVASEEDDDGNLAQRGTREQTPTTRPAQNNSKPAQVKTHTHEGFAGAKVTSTGPIRVSAGTGAGGQLGSGPSQGIPKEPRPAPSPDTGIHGNVPAGPSNDVSSQPKPSNNISPKQQTRLFAIAGQNGWSHENIKTYLATHYSLNSTSDIAWKDYSNIVDIVSKFSFDSVMEKWKGDRKDIDGVAPEFDDQEPLPF